MLKKIAIALIVGNVVVLAVFLLWLFSPVEISESERNAEVSTQNLKGLRCSLAKTSKEFSGEDCD